jgi:hypothetical protein
MMPKSQKTPSNKLSPCEIRVKELFDKYQKDLNDAQEMLRISIRTPDFLKPEDLLPKLKSKTDKVKRPANSFILYTNQLRKYGLSSLVKEKICVENIVERKKEMPMERQLAGMLWRSLGDEDKIKKFFNELASKVAVKHSEEFPEYKLVPKKSNQNDVIKFKHHYENVTVPRNDSQGPNDNIKYTFQDDYVESDTTLIPNQVDEHVNNLPPQTNMFDEDFNSFEISQDIYITDERQFEATSSIFEYNIFTNGDEYQYEPNDYY